MIKVKEKLCSCGCGKIGRIWSKGMLKECSMRLNPSKKIQYKSAKQKVKDIVKREKTQKLHEWFLELWNKRKEWDGRRFVVKCFESGYFLDEEAFKYNSCIYSHYFPKSLRPEYALEEWNLEIVHPDVHTLWENDHSKCPKMYEKWLKLKEKYD